MPYALCFVDSDNERKVSIAPLACDNPASPFGFEDKSIERKALLLAKKINKMAIGSHNPCTVYHYDE